MTRRTLPRPIDGDDRGEYRHSHVDAAAAVGYKIPG